MLFDKQWYACKVGKCGKYLSRHFLLFNNIKTRKEVIRYA